MPKVKSVNDFRDKLAIDPDNLMDELIGQAELFWDVSEQAVIASADRDATKLTMEQTQAELDGVIRSKILKEDGKVTEAMVASGIKDHSRMKTIQDEYLAAKIAADEWNKLVEAFHQRSSMLKLVTQVALRQLFLDEDMSRLEHGAGALRSHQGDIATRRQQAKYASELPVKRPKPRRK